MSISTWFLLAACFSLALTLNAAFPRRGPLLVLPSWVASLLVVDLPLHHIALQAISLPAWFACDALAAPSGWAALAVLGASWIALLILWRPALSTPAILHALAERHAFDRVEPVPRRLLLTPFRRRRDGIDVVRDLEFRHASGVTLRLDVHRGARAPPPPDDAGRRPALLYLHGGAWLYGDKKDQGLPLCQHFASLGWVAFNANYRLSPAATWPDHLVDAKAGIAWIRANATQWNVDPAFIAIAGGSAGAHIAAMAALTPGVEVLQPGFEQADTRVQAVVASYGLYDLTNRLGLHNPEFFSRYVGPRVLKADPQRERSRFAAASPREFVSAVAQPWLILQGDADTLSPPGEAREFAQALRAASGLPVVYAELPRAQHAFDVYYCHRAVAAVELSARFLTTAFRQRGMMHRKS